MSDDPAALEGVRSRRRYVTALLLVVVTIGVLFGVRTSLLQVASLSAGVPTWGATFGAAALLLTGQLILGDGWRRLVPDIGDPVTSMWSFHAAQPGKYLPLGLGHAAGQVLLARELGLPLRPAVAAWASQTLLIVAGGVTVGTLLVFHRPLGPLRWLGLVGLLAVVAAWRPALAAVMNLGNRLTKRLPESDHLPTQRSLVGAFVTAVAFFACHGAAFLILLGNGHRFSEQVGLIGTYAMAAGISTATPVPAGLGVREGLLVLFYAGDSGTVLAAAIVLRVCVFGVEAALLAAFSVVVAARRFGKGPTRPIV